MDSAILDNFYVIVLVVFLILILLLSRKSKQIRKFKEDLKALEKETDDALQTGNLNSFAVSSRKLTEKHYEESLKKHSLTVKSTTGMLILGFLFFIFGVISWYDVGGSTDIITALSGGLTSVLSALFLNNLRKVGNELQKNLRDLRSDNQIALKIGLIEKFETKKKREEELSALMNSLS